MVKMYVFSRENPKKKGDNVVISRGFFSDETKALDRAKHLALVNFCPVKVKVAGTEFGIIFDPVNPVN